MAKHSPACNIPGTIAGPVACYESGPWPAGLPGQRPRILQPAGRRRTKSAAILCRFRAALSKKNKAGCIASCPIFSSDISNHRLLGADNDNLNGGLNVSVQLESNLVLANRADNTLWHTNFALVYLNTSGS